MPVVEITSVDERCGDGVANVLIELGLAWVSQRRLRGVVLRRDSRVGGLDRLAGAYLGR